MPRHAQKLHPSVPVYNRVSSPGRSSQRHLAPTTLYAINPSQMDTTPALPPLPRAFDHKSRGIFAASSFHSTARQQGRRSTNVHQRERDNATPRLQPPPIRPIGCQECQCVECVVCRMCRMKKTRRQDREGITFKTPPALERAGGRTTFRKWDSKGHL